MSQQNDWYRVDGFELTRFLLLFQLSRRERLGTLRDLLQALYLLLALSNLLLRGGDGLLDPFLLLLRERDVSRADFRALPEYQ
jgi:hypothetical protein